MEVVKNISHALLHTFCQINLIYLRIHVNIQINLLNLGEHWSLYLEMKHRYIL